MITKPMSRRLRYGVAVSLDGFIAGPNGEYDWIVMDPSIDFAAMYKEFDTAVMGRKTYEVLTAQGGTAPYLVSTSSCSRGPSRRPRTLAFAL
jgi:dihydrofolate reductase